MRISNPVSFALLALVLTAGATTARASNPTPARIAVGDTAPSFVLADETGASVAFPAANGRTTVLVFYRGSWCPYCARQLSELRGLRKASDAFDLYGISVDSNATSAVLATRIGGDGKGALGFPLLSDPDHRVIDAYGLHDERYDGGEFAGIPRAAVIVVNAAGIVTWARISDDYKLRPTIGELRAAVEEAATKGN